MGNHLYLYGIFPAPGPQNLLVQGLDQQPVQTYQINEFTFLYSEAQQEQYLASRRNLLGHERVLEQAMAAGHRTLLPLQFGLIVEDWETVKQQLIVPQGEKLEQLFTKLVGQREVSVKVFWQPDDELETLMAEDQDLKAKCDRLEGKTLSIDQVVQIGQVVESAMNDRKQGIVEIVRDLLNPLAVEVVENDLLTNTMIYNAAYLIPWESEAQFGNQVEVLDQNFDRRLRIRYNNFTAPFNFTQVN
jgi:hypothetical protein